MNALKDSVINHIIDIEGGYVDDPSDSGGATNYGITEKVARENGYYGDMRIMPRDFAFSVYQFKYWEAVRGDDLFSLSNVVAAEVVDTGVNMGVSRAGKFLQRCLNVFNQEGRLYNDVSVDGIVGKATLSALQAFLSMRDESALLKALNCLQGAYYIELAERREKDERFVYGWLKNRVEL